MMQFETTASQILWNYLGVLDRLYGMYNDACSGVELHGKNIENSTTQEQREKRIFIGSGSPNREDAKYHHVTTLSEFIARNSRDGKNQKLHSQNCIVMIYSIWDTVVRPSYSKSLNKKQDAISSDILGGLRLYRNAIIHGNAILEKTTKALDYVKQGDLVELTREQTTDLFVRLFDEINRINVEHVGEAFNLRFERRLNS
jgi:hypothetical protein